ncbi:MAG: chemotaxis protein CheA [Erythrobacter sp.]|uniref:chemotaxis protein CheA n=1 Tax=Erythrobacter sp. TaxID=1042 RepID=UPI00260844E7|nr:chemotaxis protein CheA [Erythrobacter sp.]MDJ0977120.1 chemotaxis protein CheA [Erythrobacter sp.]
MNDDDIQQIFFVECDEALEATEAGLDRCKAGTHDDETINAIFRGVHSIKGGAGAFGHEALQAYTHCFENLLGDIREGKVALGSEIIDLLLLANDLLRDHVEAAREGSTAPDDAALMKRLEAARAEPSQIVTPTSAEREPASSIPAADPLDDLDALLDELAGPDGSDHQADDETAAPSAQSEPEVWILRIRPHAGAMANGGEPLLWLRELAAMGGECLECHVNDVPAIDNLEVEEGYLGWTFSIPGSVSRESVEELFDFAGEDVSLAFGSDAALPETRLSTAKEDQSSAPSPTPATAAAAPAESPKSTPTRSSSSPASQSVRIDLNKLDKLINGVGELVIAQAMLTQRLENENLAHVEELAMLDTLVRDIQEHAMAFRAQPISSVFGRVPRLLRELAGSTGKHVKLEVTGESTELDKTVIERLSEPMTHLIRNAVDHGIETPSERTAAGKEAEGTLTLSAEQKAGRIVIQISDDGRGIDRKKVLGKAIKNGLVAADDQLSDEEVNQLIFAPGFSTAANVSNISGRGVGMDVVKQNVKDLGGRIAIESAPGEGTTFTLALPLTLAISDGMIVKVGDQSLVIPLAHVIESLRPATEDIKGLGTQRQMLNARGAFVPVVSLARAIGAREIEAAPSERVLVLVETESHGRAALLVDAITDQRQFVIKSLDAHYRSVDSVAGATILGNGQVALIVDVDYLVQCASGSAGGTALADAA